MNNSNYAFVLECREDPNPQARSYFVLGYSESQQAFDSQRMWPRGNWPLTVLCNQCFRLSEYSEQDIQTIPVDSKAQGKPRSTKIWRIAVLCARENCGFLKGICFQAGIGSVKDTILLEICGKQVRMFCQKCGQSCMSVTLAAEVSPSDS